MQIEAAQKDVRLVCEPTGLSIEAAASSDGALKLPRFSMLAYSGGPMRVGGWRYPVVVDLAGMSIPSQYLPIRFGHDSGSGVGHADSIRVENGKLVATGVISRDTAVAKEVVASAKNGFPWQASIGAGVEQHEFISEGQSAQVNGRSFSGPINIVRKSVLGEISFVDLGADTSTSANVAASAAQNKETSVVEKNTNTAVADPVAEIRAKLAAETDRVVAIHKVASKHPELAAQAIREGWDQTRTELEVMRAERPAAPSIAGSSGAQASAEVIEAAICASFKLEGYEKKFSEPVLEAAHKQYRERISLHHILMQAAHANGYTGQIFSADPAAVLRAAFSTFTLPGILSNVANKFLLESFNAVEASWREIAATRNVRDFKQVTSYRLTGGMEYEQVAPDGQLKHGAVGEMAYTNQIDTYGKIFQLTRKDIINDDLNALASVPRRIGRGAALKLNDVFWKAFLNNAAFFSAANKNFLAGVDTPISIEGMTKAFNLFNDQTDPDGYPLAVPPAILLVPNALVVLAQQLMQATELRDTTASQKYATSNPFTGKFGVVRSSYLSSVKYTGNSTKAWYLLANPADLPVIEVAFLNGQELPTVESTDADFDSLGIRFRGYHDFGVSLQEQRGGVRMKGEA